MGSIKDRVAIIGMGCTKFGENWDKSAQDMMVEAAYEAYNDAGIEPKDIEAAWVGTVNSGEVGNFLAVPLRLQYIPVTRVENRCATGTDTVRNACYAVAAGIYDIVLALGVEKLKDTGFGGLGQAYTYLNPVLSPRGAAVPMFAQVATRYFHRYGIDPMEGKKIIGQISVKSHHNGSLNPKAHFQREVTLEQVLNAPIMGWPLGLFDCCPVTDGAAAAILTTPEIAKRLKPKGDYLLVKALQIAAGPGDHQRKDDYDMIHWEETVRAAKRAYEEAGIKDPFKDLSMVELHDCFSITELVTYEDLGLCPRGKAREYVEAGTFTLEGQLPVQPDGGLKSFGHPLGASGIRMIYEIYLQNQGRAGKRQLKNPGLGLTHNLGGAEGGFIMSVAIFGPPGS
ncbi:MAG: acetyl-CoA acetyltransferase [Dehalococcoidia bacterium]|nr:acetyl-CoA acetyltransferase [Dehalococcoidia bacterium]